MNSLRLAFWLIVIPLLSGCLFKSVFGKADHSHDPWELHRPTSWRTTPKGHVRDAGPFQSVAQGFETDAEIDQAIDAEFDYFYAKLPQFAGLQAKVIMNDDYVMWVGQWAAGAEPGIGAAEVAACLWSRQNTPTDPGRVWIKRAPGVDQWGENHPTWRSTVRPFVPALAHELLHAAIGDPLHRSPLWATLGR